MPATNALLRFDGAVRHDPAVDAWLDSRDPALGAIARAWFQRMREAGDDVTELMHDGFATACVQDAPFAYIGVFKSHVNAGFFHGAELDDPAGLLEGNGRSMRHVKLRPGAELNAEALQALIDLAHADIVWRLQTSEA